MRVRRTWAAAGAVAALALAVGARQEWLHATRFHEHVSGARGTFPAALGSRAPSAPDRVVRKTSDSFGVDGALSVDVVSDGVMARDLRTGTEYWHYGRHGTDLRQVGFTGRGDTVATWWNDGFLVAVDVRSGRPRWRAKVPQDLPRDGSGFSTLALVGSLVIAESQDGITAFAVGDGTRVWRGALPKGCGLDKGQVFAMRGAIVAPAQCGKPGSGALQLLAFDTRRGTLRWKVANDFEELVRADDDTLVTAMWGYRGGGARVDVSGKQPVITTRRSPDETVSIASDAGIMVCDTTSHDLPERTLTAFGVADGQQRWARQPAEGTRFGWPLLVDGRVYVVQQPELSNRHIPQTGPSELLVLDARTGRQLHTMRLPALPVDSERLAHDPSASLTAQQAVGGVVTIGWSGLFAGPTGDQLVVAE